MHRRRSWVATASVALLVAAAGAASCGGESKNAASDEGAEILSIHVHAGELYFDPEVISVKVGDTVRVVFDNHGATLHDFTTDGARFIILSEQGAAHGGAGHDEAGAGSRPLHVAAEGGTEAELLFKAEAPGEYAVFCSVPGHRDGGMEAQIIVTS